MSDDRERTWPVGPPVNPRCYDNGHVVMGDKPWTCLRCFQPVAGIDVPYVIKPTPRGQR